MSDQTTATTPELWWSPSQGLIDHEDGVWWRRANHRVSLRHEGLPNALPADAVRLVAEHDTTDPATEIWQEIRHELGWDGPPAVRATEAATPSAIVDAAVKVAVEREARKDAELDFVAERYRRDGSGANFRSSRCTGISSDALAWYGVGAIPEPGVHRYPRDTSDLAACERTYEMAPQHVQKRMLPVLEKYRAAVAEETR